MTRTLNPTTGRYEYDPLPVAKKPSYNTLAQRLSAVEYQLNLLLKK